jgi:hypothetical protein
MGVFRDGAARHGGWRGGGSGALGRAEGGTVKRPVFRTISSAISQRCAGERGHAPARPNFRRGERRAAGRGGADACTRNTTRPPGLSTCHRRAPREQPLHAPTPSHFTPNRTASRFTYP